jgi:uncharacterized membrane protein
MVAARWLVTGRLTHAFLLWNLFLAWMPFFISLSLIPVSTRLGLRPRRCATLLIGLVWLIFFPNSTYIFTDLIHVINGAYQHPGSSEWITSTSLKWFDLILSSTVAFTGHFIGLVSLYVVQASVRSSWGRGTAWFVCALSILLSSMGIYIGRFTRLNSWDIFIHPAKCAGKILAAIASPQALLFSLCFSFFIALTYLMLYIFKSAKLGL